MDPLVTSEATLGRHVECTLYGSVAKGARAEELSARLQTLCEARSERRLHERESVFRARDPKSWSHAEVAQWAAAHIGRDAAAALARTLGPSALLETRRADDVARYGVPQAAAEALVRAAETLRERYGVGPRCLGFDGDARVRTDVCSGRRTLRFVHDRVPAEQRVRVDARTVVQLCVADGDPAVALEYAGLVRAFDWERVGRAFVHHSGVHAALYEVRRVASPHHQQQQQQQQSAAESAALADSLVVELRINATLLNLMQAAEHLSAFAASLAPFEFFPVAPSHCFSQG